MTKSKNDPNVQRDLFPIPSEIAPASTKCLTVRIPDNDDHERIFYGAIGLLTHWWNWTRTGDTTGSQLAEVWRDVIEAIVACEDDMAIDGMRMNGCVIEYLQGGVWIPLIDIEACASAGPQGPPGPAGPSGPPGQGTGSGSYDGTGGVVNTEQLACNFATGLSTYMIRELRDTFEYIRAGLLAGVSLVNLITNLVEVIPVIGPVVDALADMATDFAEYDMINLIALCDQDREEIITCKLKCWIIERNPDGGEWTREDLEWLIWDKFQPWAQLQPPVLPYLTLFWQAFAVWLGAVNMNTLLFRGRMALDNVADCDFCEPCPDFSICWDMSDLSDITINIGSLSPGTGNPAPSIQSASGVNSAVYPLNGDPINNGIATALTITFDTARSISAVSFDFWMSQNKDSKVGRGIVYLAEDGVTELYRHTGVNDLQADGNWHSANFSHDADNVKSIIVMVFRVSDPVVTGTAYIDNVCVD